MIRVMVVDDHPVVRMGLVGLLQPEPDVEVVAEAGDVTEALRLAREVRPDLVLMDLRMPGRDGIAGTTEILAVVPAARVIVLTTYETDSDVVRAVGAGASDYLLKDCSGPVLLDAIRAVVRSENPLSPTLAARLVGRMRDPHPADTLSPRELEVLRLVAVGLSNAEIGRRLYIGESTVKTHLVRIFAKLGVSDRTAAVTSAITAGHLPYQR